jgi:4-hydroxy 2-oxovalerate aldolase
LLSEFNEENHLKQSNSAENTRAITVLDCTLRDGGYYNNWDFGPDVVQTYLDAALTSGIDIVELGFRSLSKTKFCGPYAYTTESHINSLRIPQGLTLCVMINADEYLNKSSSEPAKILLQHFLPRHKSQIGMVRIAAHVEEVGRCFVLVDTLTQLGYRVGLNIMQVTMCSHEKLTQLAQVIQSFKTVEVLYFADSLGNMPPEEVQIIVTSLRQGWSGPLGFHGHDNLGNGVKNTLVAVDAGATWLDATVTGMGRGAGNTQMEYLLVELSYRKMKEVNSAPIIDLASKEFADLKRLHGWGTNVFYYLGALHGVHPTYVQDLLSQNAFSPNDIAFLIELLGQTGGASYKSVGISNALNSRYIDDLGNWSSISFFAGKNTLIVAGGNGARRHWPALQNFIERENLLVIILNKLDFVPDSCISAVAACHPGRLIPFISGHKRSAQKPLITPFFSLPERIQSSLDGMQIWNYGMRVKPGVIQAVETGCTIPSVLVAPYALCAAIAGGVKRIYLAGFDGFDNRDARFHEMNDILIQMQELFPDITIISLTPTAYAVTQKSIYALQ